MKEASISPEIPVTKVRKSWFAEPKTSPNGSPTVRVALQEPKTVTQLRFFKLSVTGIFGEIDTSIKEWMNEMNLAPEVI